MTASNATAPTERDPAISSHMEHPPIAGHPLPSDTFVVSVGIGLPCLYESPPLLDHRRAPLRASGTLCTTPLPLPALAHCSFILASSTLLDVQIWHTKGQRTKRTGYCRFWSWSSSIPAIPRCVCFFFSFFRPTVTHGRPLFKVTCPDAMLLDPIRAVLCIFRQA